MPTAQFLDQLVVDAQVGLLLPAQLAWKNVDRKRYHSRWSTARSRRGHPNNPWQCLRTQPRQSIYAARIGPANGYSLASDREQNLSARV
jgi:hypothetical protein